MLYLGNYTKTCNGEVQVGTVGVGGGGVGGGM